MRGAIHVKCARTCRGKQTDIDHPVHERVRFFTLFHVIKLQRLIGHDELHTPFSNETPPLCDAQYPLFMTSAYKGGIPFSCCWPKEGGGVKIADIQV